MACNPDDVLWLSVSEALNPVLHLEGEWEQTKLEKRVRDYFKKAGKGLEFKAKPWYVLVNEYSDAVFSSLFQALRDREWLTKVDFLLAMDAAIRDSFPASLIEDVPQEEFERAVLAAHDRAFEEQRYLPILWQLCSEILPKGKLRRRIYDAIEKGRKVASARIRNACDPNEVKAFLSSWVDSSIRLLSKASFGDPASAMDEDCAVEMFHGLLQNGALPIPLAVEHGRPPDGWPFVEYTVHQAYLAHDKKDLPPWDGVKRKKKNKNKGDEVEKIVKIEEVKTEETLDEAQAVGLDLPSMDPNTSAGNDDADAEANPWEYQQSGGQRVDEEERFGAEERDSR